MLLSYHLHILLAYICDNMCNTTSIKTSLMPVHCYSTTTLCTERLINKVIVIHKHVLINASAQITP